jgi:hypothetical protein
VRIAGQVYVPFLRANALAADAGAETFQMEAMGLPYEQGTFKYQLKCLRELQARYGALEGPARVAVDELIGAEWRELLA